MAERAQWKSRIGFVLAAAGSAVGLGNIWKFPYITGENGGGLFVLIYLVCIVLVGLPIMMAEIMIGRASQKQPVGAFEALHGRKTFWTGIGWMGVATGFIILSYYVVVAGWAMDYTLKSVVNFTKPIEEEASLEADRFIAFSSMDEMRALLVDRRIKTGMKGVEAEHKRKGKPSSWDVYERFETITGEAENSPEVRRRLLTDPEIKDAVDEVESLQTQIKIEREKLRLSAEGDVAGLSEAELFSQAKTLKRRLLVYAKVEQAFGSVLTDGWMSLMWATVFMCITMTVVAGGVSAGIERACKVLMPTLFVLICTMVVYGAFQPGFPQAFAFVFRPDPSKLKASGVLEALGHAFFTLSLGMGAMMTYGSYQGTKTGLAQESLMITFLDTLIALLACLMIFPIIFSYGQEASEGPGLVFQSMPLAFAEIGTGGMLLSILFFGLLFFAALTSAISLLEVIASYLIDQKKWSRPRAAITTGTMTLLVAIPTAFSNDENSFLVAWNDSFPMSFFDTMDHLASNWMLPLGGLLIAIYAGWVMPRKAQMAEVTDVPPWLFQGWVLLIRIVAPALVVIVMLQKVGILDADELLRW